MQVAVKFLIQSHQPLLLFVRLVYERELGTVGEKKKKKNEKNGYLIKCKLWCVWHAIKKFNTSGTTLKEF